MVLVDGDDGSGSAYDGDVETGDAVGAEVEGDRVMNEGVEELAFCRKGEGEALYGVYLSGTAKFGAARPLVRKCRR